MAEKTGDPSAQNLAPSTADETTQGPSSGEVSPEEDATRQLIDDDDEEMIATVQLGSGATRLESPVNQRFGKYEILEKIGAGGFGLVQKGQDPILRRTVAIKTCTSAQERVRQRFFREAQISAGLQHPNITTVHDLGFEEGVPYLVQEFLTGEDLSEKVERKEDLPTSTRVDYLLQAARGLHNAHENGVLHRDVKPGNVRILENGRVKLLDFGIARLEEEENPITTEGVAIGTVGYLSPEQLEGGQVDRRTDIFAFGVMAYEMLTYQRPFPGNKFSEVAYKLMFEDPRPLGDLWPDCPATLEEMVNRCLEKDRDKRYPSLAPVIDLLEDLLEAIQPNDRPSLVTSAEMRARETPDRKPPRHLLVAIATLVVLGVLGWSTGLLQGPSEPDSTSVASQQPADLQQPSRPDSSGQPSSGLPENGIASSGTDETSSPPSEVENSREAKTPPSLPEQNAPGGDTLAPKPLEDPPARVTTNPNQGERSGPAASERTSGPETSEALRHTELSPPPSSNVDPDPSQRFDEGSAGTNGLEGTAPHPTENSEETAGAALPPSPSSDDNPTDLSQDGDLTSEASSTPDLPVVEVPPEVLEQVTPIYPERARRGRKEGRVLVGVLVDENGTVTRTVLVKTSLKGYGFEEAARRAAAESRFQPGTRDGNPARMWSQLVFEFQLQ